MPSAFAPLACYSFYSFLWGTVSPEALCRRARQRGVTTLALTDREGLYGVLPFWEAARQEGIRPILGAHLPSSTGPAFLLAADARGYGRISRILTRLHRERRAPWASRFSLLESLREDREGVVVLSPSRPFLERLARDSGTAGLFAALYPHGPQQELLRLSRRGGIPLAAVAPVCFLDPGDYPLHRLLRAIGLSTTPERVPRRETAPPWASFQTPHQWVQRYLHCPEALWGMARVAETCCMKEPPWGPWVFPPYEDLSAEGAFALLDRKARAGARRRYGALARPVRERLDHELGIIRAKGLASYFLVVEDIVRRFPITCGRGSAAASLVSYALGITHVDPLKHDLFFERFLNPGRTDPPDIDVDFPWDERDAVLGYVLGKYGPRRSAMVANHVRFGPRAAVREVARVYGMPEEEIRTFTHTLSFSGNPHRPSLAGEDLGCHAPLGETAARGPWPEILGWARRIEGLPRHLSVHCGGVVITPGPLTERVPVETAPKGVPVIQWEKDITEAAGLVKIDLLGNRSLAVIRDALAALREGGRSEGPRTYAELDPLEDPGTREMLARGETIGVFYVESPAMRQLLKKTGKGDYAHLVVQSSIIRPAANEYIREYVRRVHGGPYAPLSPLLEGILRETHGILCYQEDVSRVAMALAGFDATEADLLRKVLSKKHRQARLADFRDRFFTGARRRGVPRAVVEEVWRMILSFQGYSFCKPHSASYALVSLKSCYLKAHHPAEFMAAVLSNQGGYYTPMAYLSEARRMGLEILPPDVNESRLHYTGRDRELRVGLMQLKGVGRATLEALLRNRERRGPYHSLEDLLERTHPDPADVKVLVRAGCLDSVAGGRSRPELMWELAAWEARRRSGGSRGRGRNGNGSGRVAPASLFSGSFTPPPARPYGPGTRLRHELEALGLLVSCHPLELYRPLTDRLPAVPARELGRHVGRRVTMVGWFVTAKTVLTSKEEPMQFVSFEDATGIYETTFFPRAYERFCRHMTHHRPYLLRGRVEEDFGALSLTVEDARPVQPAGDVPPGRRRAPVPASRQSERVSTRS